MENVPNYYERLPKNLRSNLRTYDNFPTIQIKIPFTMLIIGPKGSMKTNAAMAVRDAFGCWSRFYLFAPTLEQPLYQHMIKVFDDLGEKMKEDIICYGNAIEEVPPVEDFDKHDNNLLITDDFSTDDMSQLRQYPVKGRHKNISHIHIGHDFFDTPKLMRRNTDVLILKGINNKTDLKRILLEYQHDFPVDFVMKLYNYATEIKHPSDQTNFFLFHNNAEQKHQRYRKNFQPILSGNEDEDAKKIAEINERFK